MNEIQFDQVLEQLCMEEYSVTGEVPVHHFSLRHRRNMKRILALPYSVSKPSKRLKLNQRKVLILIAVIFLAVVVVTGAVRIYFYSSFSMKEHSDNTQLFVGNASGVPEVIEQVYCLSELPEGYKEIERVSDNISVWTIYQYSDDANKTIVLTQTVKKEFDHHFNTEGYPFEEVEINGHKGLFIDWSNDDDISCEAVWDNGEYIFTVEGNLSKISLLDLAKSAKVE